jgi:hypothetical protein
MACLGNPREKLELTVRVELPDDGLDDSGSGGHVPPTDRHGWASNTTTYSLTHTLHCTSYRCHGGKQLRSDDATPGMAPAGVNSRGDVTPLREAHSRPALPTVETE